RDPRDGTRADPPARGRSRERTPGERGLPHRKSPRSRRASPPATRALPSNDRVATNAGSTLLPSAVLTPGPPVGSTPAPSGSCRARPRAGPGKPPAPGLQASAPPPRPAAGKRPDVVRSRPPSPRTPAADRVHTGAPSPGADSVPLAPPPHRALATSPRARSAGRGLPSLRCWTHFVGTPPRTPLLLPPGSSPPRTPPAAAAAPAPLPCADRTSSPSP